MSVYKVYRTVAGWSLEPRCVMGIFMGVIGGRSSSSLSSTGRSLVWQEGVADNHTTFTGEGKEPRNW